MCVSSLPVLFTGLRRLATSLLIVITHLLPAPLYLSCPKGEHPREFNK